MKQSEAKNPVSHLPWSCVEHWLAMDITQDASLWLSQGGSVGMYRDHSSSLHAGHMGTSAAGTGEAGDQ